MYIEHFCFTMLLKYSIVLYMRSSVWLYVELIVSGWHEKCVDYKNYDTDYVQIAYES